MVGKMNSFLSDGQHVLAIPWNMRRSLSDYELSANHDFIEEYKDKLIAYSFGMILREGCWDERISTAADFYSAQEIDLHELN